MHITDKLWNAFQCPCETPDQSVLVKETRGYEDIMKSLHGNAFCINGLFKGNPLVNNGDRESAMYTPGQKFIKKISVSC